jgi:signal transduction histidine kinase
LHDADRRLLELIATPLAMALHATALSEQVQQARTATVEAAATERVRLQRELHDGLGPSLTSVAFRADAASNILRSDSDEAERLLGEVRGDLRASLDYVRRVVYGLRPIELDDLGLIGALRQKVSSLPISNGRQFTVELTLLNDPIPALSPAVELAAYRIASEALTNVLRHSNGSRCQITVAVDGGLVVTVADDGQADPLWRPGVGLRSIMDRAEELGGSAMAGPVPNGWQVCARIPLLADQTAGDQAESTGFAAD